MEKVLLKGQNLLFIATFSPRLLSPQGPHCPVVGRVDPEDLSSPPPLSK